MARRMYDLDNGTENIKVNNIRTDNIYTNGSELIIDTGLVDFVGSQVKLGNYATIARPSPIKEGVIIYDDTLKKCILYNGTAWVNLDGTSLGE